MQNNGVLANKRSVCNGFCVALCYYACSHFVVFLFENHGLDSIMFACCSGVNVLPSISAKTD